MSYFDKCLGNLSRREFLDQCYLKFPCLKRESVATMIPHVDLQAFSRICDGKQVDVAAAKDGCLTEVSNVDKLISEGWTIRVRRAQDHDEFLAELATDFETVLSGTADIHLYCTPAGCKGINWHYDAEEVFVLQTVGSKTWWLRKNTVHPWPLIDNIPVDQQFEREVMPAQRCALQPGDCLYIPSGYWHHTKAETTSLSLSIGVRALTAIDLLDRLRPALSKSLLWRQRISPTFASSDMSCEHNSAVRDLAEQLIDDLSQQLRNPTILRALMTRAT